MIVGQLILEGFQYQVVEATLPTVGPDGQPTGETVAIKALLVKDAHSGVVVELRMKPEEFDAFVASLSGRKIVVPGNGLKLLPGAM